MKHIVQVDRGIAMRDRAFQNGADRHRLLTCTRQHAPEFVAAPFDTAGRAKAAEGERK